jgi:hypothetical protein
VRCGDDSPTAQPLTLILRTGHTVGCQCCVDLTVRAAISERAIMGEIAVRALGKTADRGPDHAKPQLCTIDEFPEAMIAMLEGHRPSRMPFFDNLAAMPHWAASDPSFLGQIYLIYQSAMHATRAAVYYLPHLDSPALRKRKLQIFIDDDGLADGDTHHYQLTRAFRNIGAKCMLEDEQFGDPRNCAATSMEKQRAL